VQRPIRISEEIRVSVERIPAEDQVADTKRETTRAKDATSGFCIGCRRMVPLDPSHPYCRDCYGSWKTKRDAKRTEQHCHVCGTANKSTFSRPACYDCYRRHKGKLMFAEE
jgi:hypothetical protein